MIHILAALLVQASPPAVTLPPGPAQRAWSSTTPALAAAKLEPAVVALAVDASWDAAATWTAWAADLTAEKASAEPDPARRTRLMFAALAHGRSEDAWDHFAALSGHGDWMLAALPALIPGVAPGSSPTELADGVTLAPALPPLDRPARERTLGYGRLEKREAKLVGLRIGAALVDLRVAVEYDGVQVELECKNGETATAKVLLPELLDFEYSAIYVDWEREERLEGPHEVTISPDPATIVVYGRCKPLRVAWPTTLPKELDPRPRRNGFQIEIRPADALEPRIRGFAAALARATGLQAKVEVVPLARAAAPSSALVLQLADDPGRARKLRGLLSSTEQFALRR